MTLMGGQDHLLAGTITVLLISVLIANEIYRQLPVEPRGAMEPGLALVLTVAVAVILFVLVHAGWALFCRLQSGGESA